MADGFPIQIVVSALAIILSALALLMNVSRDRASFRVAWNKDVISWARSCVDLMARMQHDIGSIGAHTLNEKTSDKDAMEKLACLSALIDEGRFYFENNRKTDWNSHMPRAYQGFRPKLLDSLVFAYEEYELAIFEGDSSGSQKIWDVRRQFVSDLQEVIDPRWFARKAAAEISKVETKS